MKKLLVIVAVLALTATAFAADEYVMGGFEASGHVMVGTGYQYSGKKAPSEAAVSADNEASTSGPMGRYLGAVPTAGKKNHFNFFIDEVELDIAKSFGDNIRLRADMDFARQMSSGLGRGNAFVLEQAYATANIPAGNGIEFLVGRFNAPIGFESVDAIDNDTISESIILRSQMRPTELTGAKFYYAFTDAVDFHFWAANSVIGDTLLKQANMPALGARLGYNWGEDDNASTVGLSPFFGPSAVNVNNKHYLFGADLDMNWWLTESFALGLEGVFSRASALPGFANMWTFGGLLNLHYAFSDVWDGTLKYAYANQKQITSGAVNFVGTKEQIHEIALAGGYAIADGATLKLEGRFDIVAPSSTTGFEKQYVFGAVLAMGYEF